MQVMDILSALPARSQVEMCGTHTFAVEPVTDAVWDELQPLLQAHWDEMPGYHVGEPLNPEKTNRQFANASAQALFITVRDANQAMVGYCFLRLFDSNMSGVRKAQEDALFIYPDHRHGRLFLRFMQYLEDIAKLAGATKIRINACEGTRSARMFASLGFAPLAQVMEKTL